MLGDMLSLALNAVGFVACGMVWNASRVFHGRKPNLPGLVLGALAWVAAVMTLAPEAPRLRMTIGAGIVAVYAALTATELWSERRRTLQRRWPAIAVPVLHGFVLMLPILLGDLLHPERFEMLAGSIWVTVFAIELVLYAVGTVFVIFMLVSERTVTAHKTAASMDPLTGMFNRRGFAEATSRVIEREANAGRPVTVLIFDIDHFKSINDRFGHPAGDEILKLFATVVVNTLRSPISRAYRRRGVRGLAALFAGRRRARRRTRARGLRGSGIVVEEGPVDTTVSIGVAGGPAGTELEVLLAAADTALYQAKRGGRNRVEAAEELPLSLENWRRKTAGALRPSAAAAAFASLA
jgi:diguanylate cyclase (GGDEF)-like protein